MTMNNIIQYLAKLKTSFRPFMPLKSPKLCLSFTDFANIVKAAAEEDLCKASSLSHMLHPREGARACPITEALRQSNRIVP